MTGAGRIEPIVARLHGLHPRLIDLSLDRLRRLLAQLGHPERHLPPVVHVAGTNGKGSTCAFLRAIGEAAGWRVHVYTSPHLVHFRERVRLAGQLVSDEALAAALEHVEAVNGNAPITVFEVITATALHLFASHPADLLVLEVGLGGRGDATNVVERPIASAVSSISLDHRDLLGDTLEVIAGEKAGIFKAGVPAVTGSQPPEALAALDAGAGSAGTRLLARGRDWEVEPAGPVGDGLRYQDARGALDLPPPGLTGPHQWDNAGIAVAALRAASALSVPGQAWSGIARARWPARMQRLHGELARLLPANWELWLDGGHNPGAGQALARVLDGWRDRPMHLVVGMKQGKDAADFLAPLLPGAASVWAVAEPEQHLALPVEDVVAASGGVARPGPTVADALRRIAAETAGQPGRVLVCGSLYLAGEVLKADGTAPD